MMMVALMNSCESLSPPIGATGVASPWSLCCHFHPCQKSGRFGRQTPEIKIEAQLGKSSNILVVEKVCDLICVGETEKEVWRRFCNYIRIWSQNLPITTEQIHELIKTSRRTSKSRSWKKVSNLSRRENTGSISCYASWDVQRSQGKWV